MQMEPLHSCRAGLDLNAGIIVWVIHRFSDRNDACVLSLFPHEIFPLWRAKYSQAVRRQLGADTGSFQR